MLMNPENLRRYTVGVLVSNEPGVLSRVSGLFSRRGFNIESLAVGPTQDSEVSRITIVVLGDDAHRVTLAPGGLLIVPGGTLCGVDSPSGVVYTEIITEKEITMNNQARRFLSPSSSITKKAASPIWTSSIPTI